jgi:hypothetical protein
MKIKGNKYKRCIYAYEFSDNFVYVVLESEKYTTLRDFKYNSRSAYSASAIRHNWINYIIELRKWN